MPELPEVETVKLGLAPILKGASLLSVYFSDKKLRYALDHAYKARLEKALVICLERRAKYLLFHLNGDLTLISHLGMSGRWKLEPFESALLCSPQAKDFTQSQEKGRCLTNALAAPFGQVFSAGFAPFCQAIKEKHDHAIFLLQSREGKLFLLRYNDPRRFGFLRLCVTSALNKEKGLASLGLEPFAKELTAAYLQKRWKKRSISLKAALLEQETIAGLGNIYVCEALWYSGLSPFCSVAALAYENAATFATIEQLIANIRFVLKKAIKAGGSSLRDYRQADGQLGYFQHSFSVYNRENKPCLRCQQLIVRKVQNGRSTFYCPSCQGS